MVAGVNHVQRRLRCEYSAYHSFSARFFYAMSMVDDHSMPFREYTPLHPYSRSLTLSDEDFGELRVRCVVHGSLGTPHAREQGICGHNQHPLDAGGHSLRWPPYHGARGRASTRAQSCVCAIFLTFYDDVFRLSRCLYVFAWLILRSVSLQRSMHSPSSSRVCFSRSARRSAW